MSNHTHEKELRPKTDHQRKEKEEPKKTLSPEIKALGRLIRKQKEKKPRDPLSI
jgi:hypothetical protein